MAPPRLGVGDVAPDFTLPGTGGKEYALSNYAGQPVVLVFYPGDNTPLCTIQLNAYSSDIARFEDTGAQVLAISPQDVDSHEAFTDVHGFAFPLLADVDRRVGRAYGVLGPVNFYQRSVFVIDANGTIRYAHRTAAGLSFRPTGEIIAAITAVET